MSDFKDVSMFEGIIEFAANGNKYRFEDDGGGQYKGFILHDNAWIYEGTITPNSNSCTALYTELTNTTED